LATHKEAMYRNGPEAVRISESLCEITRFAHPLHLTVLAAAYAETGRFGEAVSAAEKALALASKQNNRQLTMSLKDKLQLYEKERAVRQQ